MVLEADQLRKVYKSFFAHRRITALDHFCLKVNEGEIFGILGPNGSGKTTAMKAFLGLISIDSGSVRVFGKSPAKMAVKSRIGFLPEESYFYKFLTAGESLGFFGQLAGLSKKIVRSKTDDVLGKVGLAHARDLWVRNFSKGMLRRLGFAFILMKDPDLIFLDEPTVGLDPLGAMHAREMMIELKKRGKTIILSSHLLGEIENVCDRIAIVYQGKVLREDTLQNILEIQDKFQITVQKKSGMDLKSVASILEKGGLFVESAGHPKKNLETAFIETLQKKP